MRELRDLALHNIAHIWGKSQGEQRQLLVSLPLGVVIGRIVVPSLEVLPVLFIEGDRRSSPYQGRKL